MLNVYLFADDTSTLLTRKSIKHLRKIYNQKLKGVVDWLKAKEQTLNIDKSNEVLFRKARTKVINNINRKIWKEIVKEKFYTKYLGLLINNKLTWE